MNSKKACFLALPFLVLTFFASCKKLEQSIKRDVIITSRGTEFTIPVISNTNIGQVAGIFPSSVDLDAQVRGLTEGEFGKGNIQEIKIRSLQISVLDSPVVAGNNLGNFEYYTIKMINGQNQVSLTDITNNPSGEIRAINFQDFSPASSLKKILDGDSFTFDIRVKPRVVTTAPIKAVISATYTASLSF